MFKHRQDAGRQLAERLMHRRGQDPVVFGLPRGGVVVAAEVAEALGSPLDVLVVRKLGAPHQPELAIGAVTDGDQPQQILNEVLIRRLAVDQSYIDAQIAAQLDEVRWRQRLYRRGRPPVGVRGRTVIVVDDGIATGATVRAGIAGLRRSEPRHLVLAVPVAPPETVESLRGEVDELVCLHTPASFTAVGAFYLDFRQTSDEEVVALLEHTAGPTEKAES